MSLVDIVKNFGNARVAVLGDFCLDLLLHGKHKGFSRESAAPVLRVNKQSGYPGAAANVVYNLAKLGVGKVVPISVIGTDTNTIVNCGDLLLKFFKEVGIDCSHIVRSDKRETYVYMKFMATGEGTSTPEQQFYRADVGRDEEIDPNLESQLIERLEDLKYEVDALVISDYSKGVVTPRVFTSARDLRKQNILVIGNARKDVKRLKNLDLIDQNDFETVSLYESVEDRASEEQVKRCGRQLLYDTKADYLIVTRGERGMAAFGSESNLYEDVQTKPKKIVDITGAGDTSLAAITAALCASRDHVNAYLGFKDCINAAKIGNYAAGIVVQKPGTATATQKELIEEINKDEMEDQTSRTAC